MNKERNLNDDAPQEIRRHIWKDLEKPSYNVNDVDNQGTTDLMAACYLHDIKLIEKLLSLKADVNIKDKLDQNVVHMVVFGANNADLKDSNHILYLLAQHNVNVNQKDISGIAPLALSCCYDMGPLTQRLIAMKADINNVDEQKQTALSLACSNEKIDAIYSICMTASEKSDIENLRNQIRDVPENISTNYTHKMLDSINLNLSLEKSLSTRKDNNSTKI